MAVTNYLAKLKTDFDLVGLLKNLYSFPYNKDINFEISNLDINSDYLDLISNLKNDYNDTDLTSLKVEFARLFVGPFKVIAPPYGSFYMEDGKIMGETTIEVQNLYSDLGLDLSESFKDLPDHIIAELEFIMYLIFNEIRLIEENKTISLKSITDLKIVFIESFLYPWIFKFTNLISLNTSLEYFRNLSKLTEKIIKDMILNLRNEIFLN